MRVLICGDRAYDDPAPICRLLLILQTTYGASLVLIHGAAPGADTIAAETALQLGIAIDRPPTPENRLGGYPYIKKLGRAGGPVRNRQMLVEGQPNVVYAFHDAIEQSKGTADMLRQAKKAGVPAYLYGRDVIPLRLNNMPITL